MAPAPALGAIAPSPLRLRARAPSHWRKRSSRGSRFPREDESQFCVSGARPIAGSGLHATPLMRLFWSVGGGCSTADKVAQVLVPGARPRFASANRLGHTELQCLCQPSDWGLSVEWSDSMAPVRQLTPTRPVLVRGGSALRRRTRSCTRSVCRASDRRSRPHVRILRQGRHSCRRRIAAGDAGTGSRRRLS